MAWLGEEDDVRTALERAGWTAAEDITLKSSWRIVVSSLRKRSSPQAAVSPLLLFGRKQDVAYQQEVDGNPSKRHHIRFWRTPEDFMTGYSSRNGGGDHIITDGDLPLVDLHDVVPGNRDTGAGGGRRHRTLSELAENAPPSVWLAGGLVSFVALVQVARVAYRLYASGFLDDLTSDPNAAATTFAANDTGHELLNLTLATSVVAVLALIQLLLAVNVGRGRYLARQLSLAFLLISFVIVAVQIFTDTADSSNLFAVFVVMSSRDGVGSGEVRALLAAALELVEPGVGRQREGAVPDPARFLALGRGGEHGAEEPGAVHGDARGADVLAGHGLRGLGGLAQRGVVLVRVLGLGQLRRQPHGLEGLADDPL